VKILWHSNAPWANTGYGQQTALFVPRLAALGHDIAISAVWGLEGSSMTMDGVRVYPADQNFGNRTLASWASHHAGPENDLRDCLVLTLIDVWPLKLKQLSMLNLASWCPVDSEPVPEGVLDYFKRTGARPIAMSRFGERMLQDAGLDPLYVPHGVDTNVYRPLEQTERDDFREALEIPNSAFLVGMVANNQGNSPSRKAFPQAIEAFGKFRKSHPDAFLYLHTELTGIKDGVNIERLLDLNDVPRHAVRFASQFLLEYGLPPEAMAQLYNAMDVLLNPAMGEGFGVPIIEAQACGVPVIAGGWTAMPELVGAGWTVDGQRFYIEGGRMGIPQRAFQFMPFVDSIADKLAAAYEARGDATMRARAREFALGYDADVVTERYWKPALAAIESQRSKESAMPTVTLNREQRRKLERAK
jgi:glycosyltransferase involved in cell wall biosynthesis